MNADIILYIRRGLVEHEIAVNFDYEIENDGIGTYEFGGRMCYDSGKDFPILARINSAYMIYHNSYRKIDPYSIEVELQEYLNNNASTFLNAE